MALGDVASGMNASVAAGAFFDIKPSGTTAWAIHNVWSEGACELYWSDGTNNLKFDSGGTANTSPMTWEDKVYEVTASYYLRVKNVHSAALKMGYSGRVVVA